MRKINKLNNKIIEEEMFWRKCNDFIKSLTNPKILIGLKKFAKSINKSKNTAKLYIRLAMKKKLDLLKYYCIPFSRDSAFPIGLSEMIAKQYKLECLEREKITNKKTKKQKNKKTKKTKTKKKKKKN